LLSHKNKSLQLQVSYHSKLKYIVFL